MRLFEAYFENLNEDFPQKYLSWKRLSYHQRKPILTPIASGQASLKPWDSLGALQHCGPTLRPPLICRDDSCFLGPETSFDMKSETICSILQDNYYLMTKKCEFPGLLSFFKPSAKLTFGVDNPSHFPHSFEDYAWPWWTDNPMITFQEDNSNPNQIQHIYRPNHQQKTNISLCNHVVIHCYSFSLQISFTIDEFMFIHPSYHEHPPDLFGRRVQVVASSIRDEHLMVSICSVYIYIYMHVCIYVWYGMCMYVYVCVCMCMYVYVCVCMCMYVYVCVCMCMYVYVCVCMCMYVYVCVWMCMCMYVYVCVCVCMCMCMYVYVCVCMCMYVYVCVCMCMYVYVCVCMCMYVYVCIYVWYGMVL